jgi:hypothetical protein
LVFKAFTDNQYKAWIHLFLKVANSVGNFIHLLWIVSSISLSLFANFFLASSLFKFSISASANSCFLA